jgi:hypothetical protein
MTKRIAALFDIHGTLIITGGAGAAAWRLAFDELYGIPADIGEFTDTGKADPTSVTGPSRPWSATSPLGPSSTR